MRPNRRREPARLGPPKHGRPRREGGGIGARPLVAGLLIMAALAWAAPTRAQSRWDALAYGSGISYVDSRVKTGGLVAGFYGTYGTGYRHLVEVGGAWTGIDNRDGTRLSQVDASAAYSLFGSRASGRLGAHLISSSDPLTAGALILFGGGSVYRVGLWSAGAEVAWSSYPDYQGGLDVLQAAPSVGFTAYTDGGGLLAGTVRGYAIHLSDDPGLGDTDFFSAEAALSWTAGDWTVSGFAWGGEQAFAVRDGGFLAFNLSELHTGGFGGGVRWVVAPKAAVSAGLYVERFQDLGFAGDAWARLFSFSIGLTL